MSTKTLPDIGSRAVVHWIDRDVEGVVIETTAATGYPHARVEFMFPLASDDPISFLFPLEEIRLIAS